MIGNNMTITKHIQTTMLLLLLCGNVAAQGLQTVKESPLSQEMVYGPVKEIKISNLLIFDKDTTQIESICLSFNRERQLVRRESFWNEEYTIEEYHYVDGRPLMVIKLNKTLWGEIQIDTTTYYYTSNGCPDKYITGNDTTLLLCDSLCHITMEIFHNYQDTIRCTYDEYDRMVRWCNWERCDEGCDGCTTYIYDSHNKLVKEQHRHRYSNGDKEYIYNKEGYVSDYTDTFGTREQIHLEYTYDNHSNWLTRRYGFEIAVREITYYE